MFVKSDCTDLSRGVAARNEPDLASPGDNPAFRGARWRIVILDRHPAAFRLRRRGSRRGAHRLSTEEAVKCGSTERPPS